MTPHQYQHGSWTAQRRYLFYLIRNVSGNSHSGVGNWVSATEPVTERRRVAATGRNVCNELLENT